MCDGGLLIYVVAQVTNQNMADGSDWCGKLNNSALFDLLRKNASKLQGILQAKSLLAIHDGKLYVWDAYSAALLVTNLRSLKSQSSANRSQCQVKPIEHDLSIAHIAFQFDSEVFLWYIALLLIDTTQKGTPRRH